MNVILSSAKARAGAIGFMAIFYTVGILGSLFGPAWFMSLTPINLLLSLGFIILFYSGNLIRLSIWLVFVALAGYAIEWLGVKTGVIFGEYWYGNNLGYKIEDIPYIIGVNWMLMIFCTAAFVAALPIKLSLPLRIMAAAFLMALFDSLIEPVAPKMDFWHWKEGAAPIRNYMAWFVFSLVFHMSFHFAKLNPRNKAALWLFLFQGLFFAAQYINT
jgi:putative membrane protein